MKPMYQELSFLPANYINVYKEDLPHFVVPWHYHPEIEIMYIIEGTGTRFVGDSVEAYDEGDICMIGSNLPHEWRNVDNKACPRAFCYCLFIQKELFSTGLFNFPEMRHLYGLVERADRGIKFCGKTRTELGVLVQEYVKEEKSAAKIAKLILILEVMATTDEYELLSGTGYAMQNVNTHVYERLDKVCQYIHKNFSEPIRLEEVASLAGLTPNSFCRYFKKRMRKTFIQYLNEIRIGHAKKLLIEGRETIATLSMESGFNNVSNFIAQFKRSTNMLPSEYQRIYHKRNVNGKIS
ncbi:MAG: AraC family transcriptional regulator [Tannerella sp.]|jgi:AraC-like DNA-binding protein|nr:AraC family transcriptional regulator [Tannerella sp.]